MKIAVSALIVFILCHPAAGTALPSDGVPAGFLASVVQLSSDRSRSCGSGFLLANGDIVTSRHVAEGVCPLYNCGSLSVRRAGSAGGPAIEEIKSDTAYVKWSEPLLDLAVISKQNAPFPAGAFSEWAAAKEAQKVWSLGFSRCKTLELRSGSVSSLNPLWTMTTVKGTYGNSGSPLFDADYKIVGVIDEALSVSQAVRARLIGEYFALRAVRGDVLFAAAGLHDEHPSLASQVQIVENFYSEVVIRASGQERLYAALDFMRIMDGMRDPAVTANSALDQASLGLIAQLGSYPASSIAFAQLRLSDLGSSIERLTLAYNLEYKGLNRSLGKKIAGAELVSLLSGTSDEARVKGLKSIISDFEASGFPGVQQTLINYAIFWLPIAVASLIIWALSVAHVWFSTCAGVAKRLFVCAIVGIVFWPLSYIVFLFTRRTSPSSRKA